MKVFRVNFHGYYIGGDALVVAETKRKAFNQVKKELESMKLQAKNDELSMDDLVELDLSSPQFLLISNGDY